MTEAELAEGKSTEEAKEPTWNKADEKAFGTGRVPGVIQPLHQIVNRQRFIEDDSDKVNAQPGDFEIAEEWTGITAEGEEAPEIIDNDLEVPADAEVSGEADEDDSESDDDNDESVVWEDLVGAQAATSSSPAKKRQADDVASDEDEGKKVKRQAKEPRMKTNKKKAENFFTHANVKNKNRERKIPRPEGKLKKKEGKHKQ